jgi:hypothetical protein
MADLTGKVGTNLPYELRYKGWRLFRTSPITHATVVSNPPTGITISEVAPASDGRIVGARISMQTAGTYTLTVTAKTAVSGGYEYPYDVTLEVTA